MDKIRLTNEIISKIKKEAFELTHRLMGGDLKAVILYGSCARGDFAEDSDVDIALLTRCNRKEGKKYDDGLDVIATKLAMKYFAVVNFSVFQRMNFWKRRHGMAIFKI